MLISPTRSLAALTVAVAYALTATAKEPAPMIKKGMYEGKWHDDKVKFDVEKVSKNGKFSGVIHFDPNGKWKGATSQFTGEIAANGSIVIQRPDSEQMSKAGAPKRDGKNWVWTGETTGKLLDKAYPFEMKIPE